WKMSATCCASSRPVASRAARCSSRRRLAPASRLPRRCRWPALPTNRATTSARSDTSKETTPMATTSVALRGTAQREQRGLTNWHAGWRVCVLACAGFIALFVGLGMYMHAFAWSAGIDAASPEFALYWRSLLLVELVGGGI